MKNLSVLLVFLTMVTSCLTAFSGQKFPWVHMTRGTVVNRMQLQGDSLYALTGDGFIIVNRKSLVTSHLNTATGNLPLNNFQSFFVDSKRRIWLAADKKVFLWDKNNWKPVIFPLNRLNENANFFSFSEDVHGAIWGSEFFGDLVRFGDDGIKIFDSTNSPLNEPAHWLFDVDPAGGIWVNSLQGILHFKDGTWTTISNAILTPCMDGSAIRMFRGDANGHVWILTYDRLIEATENSCLKRFTNLKSQFGAPAQNVYSDNLSIDAQGNKWVGFPGSVVCFSDTAIRYDLTKLQSTDTNTVGVPLVIAGTGQDKWFFGKNGSLLNLNKSTEKVEVIPIGDSKVPDNPLSLVTDSQGRLLVGSTEGLDRLENGIWTKLYPASNVNPIPSYAWFYDLEIDNQGNIIGCVGGNSTIVFKPDGTPVPPPSPFFGGNFLTKSVAGDIWAFGSDLDTKTFQIGRYDGIKWVPLEKILSCKECRPTSAAFDKSGTLWLGTSEGLFRFKDSVWTILPSGANGPVSNLVGSFAFDTKDRLWMTTDKGISIYDGVTWKNLTKNDFGGRSEIIGKLKRDAKGRIWMGTASWKETDWVGYYFNDTLNFLEISDGLLENHVNDFEASGNGYFHIASPSGLNTFKESEVAQISRRIPLFLRPVKSNNHDVLGRRHNHLNGKNLWKSKIDLAP